MEQFVTLLCDILRSLQLMTWTFQLAILLMPLRMCWRFIKLQGSQLQTTSASGPRGKLSNTTSKKKRMAWRAPAPLLVLVFSLTLLSRVRLVVSTAVDFRVTSKGWYDRNGNYARFYVDNNLVAEGSNGFNLVTLTTGAAGFAVTEIAMGLNMYTNPSSSSQTLYDAINAVPTNTIVCASVNDTPKGITSTGFAGLHMIGGQTTAFPTWRQSYILCGRKGHTSPIVELGPVSSPLETSLSFCDDYSALIISASCAVVTPVTSNVNDMSDSESSCVPCAAGRFSTSGSTSCSICPSGTYSIPQQANECTNCPLGKHIADDGQDEDQHAHLAACVNCSPGKAAPALGSIDCLDCGPGTFSSSPPTSCSDCSPGTYSAGLANSQCDDCPAGTVASSSGSSFCSDCGPGTFSSSPPTSCSDCSPGTYSAGLANSQCDDCLAGTAASSSGSSFCSDYGPGTFSSSPPTSCSDCSPGTYSAGLANSQCDDCLAGTVASSSGSSFCSNCGPGTFSATPTNSCSICSSGRYSTASANPSCTSCPEGKYNDDEATTAANHNALSTCLDCPIGTFSTTSGASSSTTCVTCPQGSFTSMPSSTVCSTCPAGRFNDDLATSPSLHDSLSSCPVCPAGKINTDPATSRYLHITCDACPRGKKNEYDGTDPIKHNSPDDCEVR
ncbi:hypothetical protein TrCOL_g12018 [Triparma columacea]|uniref:Tyrosine-protein kinase ephrin type A/B receptor-like domain-containing protein n=1 Tax=Triparma columacea TaxID=722753 RepID=A0A9W7GFB6_9STRA|nr:hypothetical protein TrCOL_g12018 [Triparma columacea]